MITFPIYLYSITLVLSLSPFYLIPDFLDAGFWKSPQIDALDDKSRQLMERMKHTALAARAQGTVEGYQRALNRWKIFAKQTLQVPSFPVSPLLFALYLQFLLEESDSVSSINTAFYAVNWAHKLAGLDSPTDHSSVILIKEGAVRMCSSKSKRKEPLEVEHLRALLDKTNCEDLLQLRNLVMCVISFSGFLRSSELLELRRKDIQFYTDHMSIYIYKSKTDQLREGKTLVISATGSDLCPVNLLKLYFTRAEIKETSSEFIFRPITSSKSNKKLVSVNKHISYSTYRESFKKSFSGIVEDINQYSTQSGRSGGATIAANAGVGERHFQRHGRWKTEKAKNMYVKDSVESRLMVSSILGL